MDPEHGHSTHLSWQKKIMRWFWIAWRFIVYLLEYVADGLIEAWDIVRREAGLFWGTAFTLVGFFGFRSGRYCDGNTAEYLSCTRPAAFYYYDTLHTILLVAGIFLILVWWLKQRHKH